MLAMYGIAWNCHHRNWNWSGIVCIGNGIGIELPFGLGTGFGIGVELPSSELELELNCQNGIDPSSARGRQRMPFYQLLGLLHEEAEQVQLTRRLVSDGKVRRHHRKK